uniref:Putative ovule protein n=1 Tax=Solanum chacoense TaxID=4108 RepID=A0A0V0GM92_SOLCH
MRNAKAMVSVNCTMVEPWQIILVLLDKHKSMYLGHKPKKERRRILHPGRSRNFPSILRQRNY